MHTNWERRSASLANAGFANIVPRVRIPGVLYNISDLALKTMHTNAYEWFECIRDAYKNGENMPPIKLTKREAEETFLSLCMHSQDYTENWDSSMRKIMGGKRYYNLLESAARKFYNANGMSSFIKEEHGKK